MPRLTKDQLKRWNEQMGGGFRFDAGHFITWGEKQGVKDIELEDGKTLRVNIRYQGVTHNFRQVGYQPVLSLQLFQPCSTPGMMSSSGLGYVHPIGEQQQRQNYRVLCKLSLEVKDEDIMNLAKEHMQQLKNPFIF